jgi:hypothetical protein
VALIVLALLARVGARPAPQLLQQAHALGRQVFAVGDTQTGGQGQTVDGIACDQGANTHYHYHTHLSLFYDGKQIAVPMGVGIAQPQPTPGTGWVDQGSCLYWLHTHDASGIIHIESPTIGPFTLGDFFAIWGEPLSRHDVAGYHGTVYAYVDGKPYSGGLQSIALQSHEEITLAVGRAVTPPTYTWPNGL